MKENRLNSLEVEVLEVEMDLHNAGRFDPGAQYILLGGRVVSGAQTIQVVQETAPASSSSVAHRYRWTQTDMASDL